jgi:tetratricopeptide (TPR) repeat protein
LQLIKLGNLKFDKEKEDFFRLAIIKFDKAIDIMPNYTNAITSRLFALAKLSALVANNEKEILLKRVISLLPEMEKIELKEYDVACVYSIIDKKEDALFWFEKAMKIKETPTRDHIFKDSDLDKIKIETEFSRILNQYRPEK